MKDKLEEFIKQNRKICWESEYQNGEYCIGENKVRQFFDSSQLEPLAKPIIVDRKMVAHIANGVISLQKTDYIEDGAIIEINGGKIKLYEIPLYGGCPQLIGEYKTIIEAIAKSDELT